MDMILSVAIRLFFWSTRLLPVRLAGAIGAGLGRVAFHLLGRHRHNTIKNLARVYPDKGEKWHRHTARESFAELGRTMFELPHVFLRSGNFLRSRIEVDGEEAFRQAMQKGKGVMVVACHHSNWELGGLAFSLFGYESASPYRPLNQAPLDKYLKQCRERFGSTFFSRRDGLRWIPQTLKRGKAVTLMIDQHMSQQGIKVPFLGHMANTTTLPAPFVLRNRTPLFGALIERKGKDFRFRLKLWPITTPELSGNKEEDTYRIIKQINDSFEKDILERPELWLWAHRRWLVLDEEEAAIETAHGTS